MSEQPPRLSTDAPFDRLGGEAAIRQLVERFYDAMGEQEPALAGLHSLDAQGRVDQGTRERFSLFLVQWLGGPSHYQTRHGHPRLRMRHAHFPVDVPMRDAWLRSMKTALDQSGVEGDLRRFLDQRFSEVADFLRNQEE